MAAIVTDPLKRRLSQFIFDDTRAGDSNEYYIGIGKPDTYNAQDTTTTPIRTVSEQNEARANLMSVKKVVNSSLVIPRYNWTSGSTYSAWSDVSVGIPTNTYYVLTEDNEIYICLQQGKDATGETNQSIVKPNYLAADPALNNGNTVAENDPFKTADGYIWKLMYSLSAAKANQFLTSGFIPIENLDSDTATTPFENQQVKIQSTAQDGKILGVRVINGGSGYTGSTTPVTFRGNGIGGNATAFIADGSIVKVELNDSANAVQNGGGAGYDYASCSVTGNAQLISILSPQGGIGKDPVADLKCSSVMYNVKTDGTENGTFTVDNDFRQITLLRNIENHSQDRLTGQSFKVGRFMDLTSSIASILPDDLITDDTRGVTARVVEVDSDGGGNTRLRYIQNSNNIIGPFGAGNDINSSTAEISTDSDGYVNIYSGELMYIENRAKVTRGDDQAEDIKIILTV